MPPLMIRNSILLAREPQIIGRVLRVVCRAIETHLIYKTGQTGAAAKTGAVTLIQRFESALNLNIHFHMLFLGGVYVINRKTLAFCHLKSPTTEELAQLIRTISCRIGRYLERARLPIRNIENSHLNLEPMDDTTMDDLIGHSMSWFV